MATTTKQSEDLAEDLTRKLGIPFTPSARGSIGFREPLRITSWSVPLVFDGHAAWDRGSLVPTDFVGHVLWAHLQATVGPDDARPWWTCALPGPTVTALLEHLEDTDAADGWVIGEDVLLQGSEPQKPAKRRIRHVA